MKHFPKEATAFINCSMASFVKKSGGDDDIACMKKFGLVKLKMKICAECPETLEMMMQYKSRIQNLDPKPYYMPWIVIDGKWSKEQLEEAEDNLEKLICNLLKDRNVMSPACKNYY